jgi:predicted DNA-binding protein with PD1-like motif
MEYRSGKIGRMFAVRFDDGDDFLASLEELIVKENIRNGWFHVIGGLRQAGVVTGPQGPVMPSEPVWQEVDEVREVLGMGSIFWGGDKPKIHLHAALGHHGDTLTGCVRRITKVYLVLEVYLMELAGFAATRPWYEKGGFNRLTFV